MSYLDVQIKSKNNNDESNQLFQVSGINDQRQNEQRSSAIHHASLILNPSFKTEEVQSFTLQRGEIKYTITDINQVKNKKWIKVLKNQTIRIDQPPNIEVIKILGKGTSADVYLVKKIKVTNAKTVREKKYALKVIKTKSLFESESMTKQLYDELKIQRKLKNCETALQLRQVYESSKRIYIFLDLQEGGTLKELIQSQDQFLEKDLRTIMGQLLLGLDFMHSQNIIHRDIKPDNILMASQAQGIYEIRIADFGLATQLKSYKDMRYHKCGTPSFIAPECLRGKGYSVKFDIFSAGSMMYNMATGEYLFQDQPELNMLQANQKCNLSNLQNRISHLSKEGQDLMIKMLNPRPQKRLDCKQALNHPWFLSDKEALVQGLFINKEIKRMQQEIQSPLYRQQQFEKDNFNINNQNKLKQQNYSNSPERKWQKSRFVIKKKQKLSNKFQFKL
eukprot:403340352